MVALIAGLALLAACQAPPDHDDDDDGSGWDGGSSDGGGSDGGGSDGGGSVGGGSDGGGIDYPGTWLLQVDYALDCEWGGFVESTSHSGSWSLRLEGSNDALQVDIQEGWYHMEGAGSDSQLFLSGSFPFEGYNATAVASDSDNAVTFTSSRVDPDAVEGAVTGRFQDEQGWTCEHVDSSFTLTR